MTDKQLRDWLIRQCRDGKDTLDWPLPWDLFLTVVGTSDKIDCGLKSGFQLGALWVVTDPATRPQYNRAVSRLMDLLAAVLRDGRVLGHEAITPYQHRSSDFATNSKDRAALLASYREFVVRPGSG